MSQTTTEEARAMAIMLAIEYLESKTRSREIVVPVKSEDVLAVAENFYQFITKP